MYRILVALSLIAAIAGPFLARRRGPMTLRASLAELGQPPIMEDVDGGVGDDSGVAVLASRVHPMLDVAISLSCLPVIMGEFLSHPPQDPLSAGWGQRVGPWLLLARSGPRLALLGRFLI